MCGPFRFGIAIIVIMCDFILYAAGVEILQYVRRRLLKVNFYFAFKFTFDPLVVVLLNCR